MPSKSLLSLAVFFAAAAALIATSPAEDPTPPAPPSPEAPITPEAPDPVDTLAGISGRQVWMVNAPEADCQKVEALGLKVTCEPERPGAAGPEVVVWCPEIPQAAAEALVAHVGLAGAAVRTWESQPAEANPDECGQFFEIVIRY